MQVRKAAEDDLSAVSAIYADAKVFMRESGNHGQWVGNYPSEELILSDIEKGHLHLVIGDDGKILACFVYFFGTDNTYLKIFNGEWTNDLPYGVIHRISVAKDAHGMGVARFCFDYAFELCGNLKIDTHRDNIPMQKALLKSGFRPCGIIYLENGDERLAFQKSK